MTYQEDRDSFVARMTSEAQINPKQTISRVVSLITEILKLSKTHHKIQENQCNYQISKAQQTREKNIETRIIEIIKLLFKKRGGVIFSGDPRGATVKIILPSGYYDSWGGEGFCVPIK